MRGASSSPSPCPDSRPFRSRSAVRIRHLLRRHQHTEPQAASCVSECGGFHALSVPGRSVRASRPREDPRLCRDGSGLAGPRNRSQCRDLQHRPRRSAQAPAISGPRAAGVGASYAAPGHLPGDPDLLRVARQLSRLEGPELRLREDDDPDGRPGDAHGQGRAPRAQCRCRVRRVLFGPRRPTPARPPLPRRRRCGGPARRGALGGTLEDRFRREPGCRRRDGPAQRPAPHDRRRFTGAWDISGGRPTLGAALVLGAGAGRPRHP
jgi:hypothetical protein